MRKKRNSDSGASLDSLLDTMTNVVGILVIVLVVTQLGVGDAVKRIENLEVRPLDLTEEETQRIAEERETLKDLLADLQDRAGELDRSLPETRNDIDDLTAQMEALKEQIEEIKSAKVDAATLTRENEKQQKKVDALKAKLDATDEQIAKLKAQLDDTPAPQPLPRKVVNLPNPRTAPKGAEAVYFMLRNGRVYPLSIDAARARVERELALALRAEQLTEGIPCGKLKEWFDRRTIADRVFRYTLDERGGRPSIVFTPKDDQGETLEDISEGRSLFRTALGRVNPNAQYVRFLVWADSFELYLKARELAEERGFAIGWQPYNENEAYSDNLDIKWPDGLYCEGYTPPPPRPPGDTPPLPASQID